MNQVRETVLKSFATAAHDHGRCIKTALAKAEQAKAAGATRFCMGAA